MKLFVVKFFFFKRIKYFMRVLQFSLSISSLPSQSSFHIHFKYGIFITPRLNFNIFILMWIDLIFLTRFQSNYVPTTFIRISSSLCLFSLFQRSKERYVLYWFIQLNLLFFIHKNTSIWVIKTFLHLFNNSIIYWQLSENKRTFFVIL